MSVGAASAAVARTQARRIAPSSRLDQVPRWNVLASFVVARSVSAQQQPNKEA
jgi:hypothetical protein